MPRGIVPRLPTLLAAALVAACADDPVEPPTPTTITISPVAATLPAWEANVLLAATVKDQYGQVMTGVTVSWTSGDTSVVVVDASGLVTAVGNGSVAVTAATGSVSGSAAVTVEQVPFGVSIQPDSLSFDALGDTARVVARFVDANGHAIEDARVEWASAGNAVAHVDVSGLVTAVGNGSVAVTATAGSVSGSAAVTVAQVVTRVIISPAADTIAPGDTLRMVAEALDANQEVVAGTDFTWSSGNAAVVTVDASGLVQGVTEGVATITAGAGGAEASADIRVQSRERTALVALYHAADGANWENSENWLTDAPLGEWFGVSTDTTGRVSSLRLFSNALMGEIPPELGDLANLEELYLYWNELTGEIPPELGNLASLWALYLNGNELTGGIPPELRNLASVHWLNLGDNRLTGEIPPELGDLANLRGLRLSFNALTGEIPPELGDLASLRLLALNGNELTGEIPPELGDLANLRELSLSFNTLTGEIPPELGDLANLRKLGLSNNELTGEIPGELGDLASLGLLYLSHNALTGEIPPELGDLANLLQLELDFNALTGEIPPELGNLNDLSVLWLSHNRLSGCIPAPLSGFASTINPQLNEVDLPVCPGS